MSPDDEIVATYRQMAGELRSLAAEMRDGNRRRLILEIATSYEKFADPLKNRSEK
jgi:hypothetical protein